MFYVLIYNISDNEDNCYQNPTRWTVNPRRDSGYKPSINKSTYEVFSEENYNLVIEHFSTSAKLVANM